MSQGNRGRKRVRGEEATTLDTKNTFSATSDNGEQSIDNELKSKRARNASTKVTAAPVEGDCTICFENYKSDYAILRCNHAYCFKCIQEWSETENSCPLCKCRFTYIDRYTMNKNEEGKKPKKQRVKVGKKDQRDSYVRHAILQQQQQHQLGGVGIRSFSFFPLGNSVVGRQFLMNLIHRLHPHATFDDEDEEEDDDDWFPPMAMDNFSVEEDVGFHNQFLPFRAPTVGPGTDSNDPINLIDDDDEDLIDIFSAGGNHNHNGGGINQPSSLFSSTRMSPMESFIHVDEDEFDVMSHRFPPNGPRLLASENRLVGSFPTPLSRNSTMSTSRRSEPELVDLTCDDDHVDGLEVANNVSSNAPEITRLMTTGSTVSRNSNSSGDGTCISTDNTNISSNSNSNSSSSVPDSLSSANGDEFPLSGISITQTEKYIVDISSTHKNKPSTNIDDDEDMSEFGVCFGRSSEHREYQRRRQRPRQIPTIYDDFDEF